MTILIVESNPGDRAALAEILTKNEYTHRFFRSAQELEDFIFADRNRVNPKKHATCRNQTKRQNIKASQGIVVISAKNPVLNYYLQKKTPY